MKKENLGDLCDIVMGRTPARDTPEYWGKGYPWVSIADLKEKHLKSTKEQITQTAIENIRCRLIPKGTLLFSFKLSIGKMAFAHCDLYTNEAIAGLIIKDNKKLSSEYLFYALKTARFLGSNQAAMGKTLNTKSLEIIKIPLPNNFDDQIRIATLLSRVEALIATRKDNLRLLDEFLKSTFLEMFGDPVWNEKGWDTKKLPQLVSSSKNSIKRGPFGGALKKEIFVEDGYLIYEQHHALNNDYSFKRYFINEKKYNELIDFSVQPGDIIISCSGVYLGKLSIVPAFAIPGIINQALLKITLNKNEMNSIFFVNVFTAPSFKNKHILANRGSGIPNLPPVPIIKNIDFITPPITLQNQFAAIVEKAESLKNHYQQNLTELENLYGALSQKAFKGELDLSRISQSQELSFKNNYEVGTA